MTLFIYEETDTGVLPQMRALAERAVGAALSNEGFDQKCEISLTVTDSERIQAVNKDFRGIDAATDVLSFPMLSFDEIGGGYDSITAGCEEYNPETGDLVLGDIMINMDRVVSQADEYGHDLEREFAFLAVHSMLHLMGYDHMNEADEQLMRERQRSIMEEIGLTR